MKIIKYIQPHRWFIWTIVFIAVSLSGLATYVWHVSEKDSAVFIEQPVAVHKGAQGQQKLSVAEILNTSWVPADESDAVMSFYSTLNNDPQRSRYDYRFASDSEAREIGYWEIVDNAIILTPTKIVTLASGIKKIEKNNDGLALYIYPDLEAWEFVLWSKR